MKNADVRDFCWASGIISQAYMHIEASGGMPQESYSTLTSALGCLERACSEHGLVVTLAQVQRLKPTFGVEDGPKIPQEALGNEIIQTHVRLLDELKARLFLLLDQDKVDCHRAFTSDQPAGRMNIVEADWTPVFSSFPGTKYDATEAFKCYSVGRNTACVFHLMRVLELGLTALGTTFNVSMAHTNWHPALEQIEKKIREMSTTPAWTSQPDWRGQQEFYSQAASHFMILKDAWRNYTAPARGKYDSQEALDIINSVRPFMQKLATRLHE